MKTIKKVSVTPLEENEGRIIDSFNTSDNKHKNAPSLAIVQEELDKRANANDTYTKNETNNLLNGKANSTHTHTKSEITDFSHTHDDRYYTETESNNKFQTKVLSGTSDPSSSLGSNGDIYFKYSS